MTNFVDRAKFATKKVGKCWVWENKVSEQSMPKFSCEGGNIPARRAVYQEYYNVELKKGQIVVASCKNRLCVSPHCATLAGKVQPPKPKRLTRKQVSQKKMSDKEFAQAIRDRVGMWGQLVK